jgi:hypothetical protein
MPYLAVALLLSVFTLSGARAAELTEVETRWLQAGAPVIAYAREQRLPLDVVVEPQARPGDAPLAMGFLKDRCKLVLAMRGNPEGQATLDRIEPALLQPVLEAMFAHELGHCWRYVHGAWHTLPKGFVDVSDDTRLDQDLAHLVRDMRETRREEGYADLVGLAWTHSRHPAKYERVHAWLERVRADVPVPGAHHDTRAWLRLARSPQAFDPVGDLFERVHSLWQAGLATPP